MMAFDLAENAFVKLRLSPLAGKAKVSSAVDSALWDDDSPEHEHRLNLARNELVAPKTRLDAELGFFLGLSDLDYEAVFKALRDGGVAAELDSLQGLDRANLLAHRCSASGSIDSRIRRCNALVRAHAEVSVAAVAADLARVRRAAQLPPVTEEDLRAGLQRLRARHAEVLVAALYSDDEGLDTLGDWAARLAREQGGQVELIDAVLTAYEAAVAVKLEEAASDVRGELAALAEAHDADLSAFEQKLLQWDRLAQPLQLAGNARGIDEPHSRELFVDIRRTMLELANEKSRHELVLAATLISEEVFAELPDAAHMLAADREALEAIVARARFLTPLSVAVEEATDHIDRFRSQLSYGCGARAGPMVKSVMSHLANAIECRDADLAESAVSTVRDLALLIHNEHGDRDGALALTEAVLKHREHLADHLVATLEEDAATLRRNIKLNTLTSALQSGHLKQADALADELLEDADEDRADTLLGLKSVIASRRQAKRDRIIGWGVLVAVVGGVAAFNGAVETTNPQGYAAESPGAVQASPLDNSYNAASVIVPGEPKSEGGSEALVEQMPAPNMGGLLSISELLYCQNQKVRIEAAEGAVSSQPQLRRFNRAVDDFNSRCSSYQYRQEDMNRVEADIAAARSRLQAEGRRLVGNPVFVQPAEEPVYENFGADPAKAEDDEADRDAN